MPISTLDILYFFVDVGNLASYASYLYVHHIYIYTYIITSQSRSLNVNVPLLNLIQLPMPISTLDILHFFVDVGNIASTGASYIYTYVIMSQSRSLKTVHIQLA